MATCKASSRPCLTIIDGSPARARSARKSQAEAKSQLIGRHYSLEKVAPSLLLVFLNLDNLEIQTQTQPGLAR